MREIPGHDAERFRAAYRQLLLERFSLYGASAVLAAGLVTVAQAHDSPRDQLSVESVASEEVAPIVVELPSRTPKPVNPNLASTPLPKIAPTQISRPAPKPKPTRPPKGLSFADARPLLSQMIDQVPTRRELSELFPKSVPDAAGDLAHISYLDAKSTITAADVKNFKIDWTYRGAFDDVKSTHKAITPRMALHHWTAQHYPGGVEEFITSMRNDRKSVGYFQDRDTNVIYGFFDDDRHLTAHARSLNAFSVGLENEALGLRDITPAIWKQAKLWSVYITERNGLKPSDTTILGHYAADLIFDNITYRHNTGMFRPARGFPAGIRKPDIPQELIDASLDDIQAAATAS